MPINVKELRIGNWINLMEKNSKLGQVNEELIKHAGAKRINPVPLTDEILKKIGFTCDIETHPFNPKYLLKLCEELPTRYLGWDGDNFYYAVKYNGETKGLNLYFKIKYVHQLQNLYFSLTGEEIEIEEL